MFPEKKRDVTDKKKKMKLNIREKNFQHQYKILKDNRMVSLVLRENYF